MTTCAVVHTAVNLGPINDADLWCRGVMLSASVPLYSLLTIPTFQTASSDMTTDARRGHPEV